MAPYIASTAMTKDTLATVLHNPKNRVNAENILNKMSTT